VIKTRIIPILLLKGSSVVKTVQFQEERVVGDAITNVKVFSNRMADEMVIVDIEATSKKRINDQLMKRLAAQCVMPLSIGGGVHDIASADTLFKSGADKVVVNSAFYLDPTLLSVLAQKYGSQSVVFSLDVKESNGEYGCVSNSGCEDQYISPVVAAKMAEDYGAGEIILNSVDRDGVMQGYDTELINSVSCAVDLPVIAAGGCGCEADCVEAINAGASAVAAGSIFYWIGESIISLKEYMNDNGIEVRFT